MEALVYVYAYTYTHAYVYMRRYVSYTGVYVYVYTGIYVCVYMRVYVDAYTRVCAYIYKETCSLKTCPCARVNDASRPFFFREKGPLAPFPNIVSSRLHHAGSVYN